ncbi:MAG: class I SAM-dependent methyltransferase [Lapillicoccus sp.]
MTGGATPPRPSLPGTIPSPNIWSSPLVYEVENLGVDRAGLIEVAMREVLDWAGRDVVDLGCGTGFHLPRFASEARTVVGVEPHPELAARARRRVNGHSTVRVVHGTAAQTGLPDASVDVAHARWAYFFGPGCEPGLVELDRVVRAGGAAFVIDNDATRSTFGSWFRQARPDYDPAAVERFWRRQGWRRTHLDIAWAFDTRVDFEAVVRLEFAPGSAERILTDDLSRTGVDYAVNLWWRRF